MFFCDPCAEENGWPLSFMKSRGQCEICEQHAVCNDIPSSALPKPKKKPNTFAPLYGAPIDIDALLDSPNLPAILRGLLEEVHYARPLIDAIAKWERENGTIAGIMPSEYGPFFATFATAAIKGSARGSQSSRYDRKDVDD